MSIVKEPGTIRTVHYNRAKGEDGRFPVTYWGTLEEQIAEATAANARSTSSHDHRMQSLYTYVEDCGHLNPEDDERFEHVEDLIEAWVSHNLPMLAWQRGDEHVIHTLRFKNRQRAYGVIPIAAEWHRAQEDYDDQHVGTVCLASPMGECCTECTEGDEDFGYEPEGCRLAERVREEYDDFWDRASADWRDYRKKQEAS
ncbi:hypothetical protein [Microbacterium sp. K24]|uniref:hypothetical protein n=1 Tax=Microbacterium sp. K24 TaxID=2305446 RepID=UPI00109CC495|nr:hypothetical protein [Microbacterium sp. K24]